MVGNLLKECACVFGGAGGGVHGITVCVSRAIKTWYKDWCLHSKRGRAQLRAVKCRIRQEKMS